MRKVAPVLLAAIAVTSLFAMAPASAAACAVPDGKIINKGALTYDDFYHQDVVQQGEVFKYTLQITAPGEHYMFLLGGPDNDIEVCKSGNHVCGSGNPVVVPDGCLAAGLEGWPGMGEPLVGTGTYTVYVRHCFSADCGLEDTGAPGAFVLAWQ